MLRLTGFLQASCARRGREATTSGRGTGVPSSLLVLRSRGYCHGRAPVGDRGALDDAVAGLPRPAPLRGLGHPARLLYCEADDGSRTRDLRLGKPTLYQLSYVRAAGWRPLGAAILAPVLGAALAGAEASSGPPAARHGTRRAR